MKKALALLIILFAANASVSAKSKSFVWQDEICAYEGRYDDALYTKKQLENTYRLWYSRDFELEIRRGERSDSRGLREPATISRLDYEYALKSAALKKLEIVDVPYWQNVKRKKLKALEQKYVLERLTLQASENPALLIKLEFAAGCLEKFAKPPTAGGEALTDGFWDCVDSGIDQGDDESIQHANFRRLFRRVKTLGCDYA